MKRIYLVRHGESTENARAWYVGESAQLTARGMEQAQFVAERFASIPFDVVLTSTMERAMETGKAIAERSGARIEHHTVFSEFRRPSECNDKSFHDPVVREIYKKRWENIHEKDWHYSDEENFFDIKRRAQEALTFLVERHEENIVVATHETFLNTCACLIIAGEAFTPDMFVHIRSSVKTRNTGITVCEYENDAWKLLAWNDHAHLGDPKKEDGKESIDGASL